MPLARRSKAGCARGIEAGRADGLVKVVSFATMLCGNCFDIVDHDGREIAYAGSAPKPLKYFFRNFL